MPRGKNKNTFVNKQIKRIENRLIQISMVVDDYIYHNKPLSGASAEMYMKEVFFYKDKCFGDERSLQVIEKLIRFMKGIIIEQGHEGINLDDLNNLPSTGPIYSVLDDLSQSTQNLKLNTLNITKAVNVRKYSNKNKTRNINVISTHGTVKNGKKNVISQESDIVDLCSDNVQEIDHKNGEGSQAITKNDDKVASLQASLSNLYITNFDVPTPNLNTEECSQSILSGFIQVPEPISKSYNKNPTVEAFSLKPTIQMHHTQPFTEEQRLFTQEIYTNNNINIRPVPQKYKEFDIHKEIVHPEIYTNHIKGKATNNNISNEPDPHTKVTIDNRSQVNIKIPESAIIDNVAVKKNKRTQKSTKINKPQAPKVKKPRTNKQNNKNNDLTIENSRDYQNKVENKKRNNAVTVDYSTINQNKVENKKLNNAFTTLNPRHNQIKQDNNKANAFIMDNSSNNQKNLNKKNTKTTSKKTKVDLKATIYNNSIECDLSWIENIRYVREVAKDEYESITFGDNFWENYSLPDNWNNDDFLY